MTEPIRINHRIPSTMSLAGLEYLGKIAQSIPENGTIVEVGPLFGSSTWVLAKNAHPSVKVFSIDTWEPAPWIDKIEARYRNCVPFSLDAFLEYTKDCPNVTAIQGWSPDVVSDWDRHIDMFFDDATHGDPGFSDNLNFFLPFIRETGILCGDDYSSGWPDIVRVVDALGSSWSKQAEVIGRVWSMTMQQKGAPEHVADRLDKSEIPIINVATETISGAHYELPPSVWSGSLHKPDPLAKITLQLEPDTRSIELEWSLWLSDGTHVDKLKSGDSYSIKDEQRIIGVSAKLHGNTASKYKLEYQSGFCWGAGKGQRYPLSNNVTDGSKLISNDPRIAINAVRFNIISKNRNRTEKLKYYMGKARYQNWPF